ncbi:aminopeptidase P family protein [Candidatus Woesearchaeota archaeon]|nr:aminopeptidase P family protein [Candidatus Woesearchaeota archaeon]
MKLKEFQAFMQEESIDLALLSNSTEKINPNFVYFIQNDHINSILILKKDPGLFVSPIELSIAKENSKIKNIQKFDKTFYEKLKELKPNTIGIDRDFVTLNQFKNLKSKFKKIKFKDISEQIKKLRLIKTEEEINLIKKACYFADILMREAVANAKIAKTELDLKKIIEKKILDLNLNPSFDPIVASSKNSKNPHHISNNTKLKGFTVIDLGVKYKNYCSDITRTVFIGKPNKKQIEIYNKVLEVQENSINNNLQPKQMHEYAQKTLGKSFNHSLGHGIGIEVHETPIISSFSTDAFKNNMVFTIEPGYYNDFGIRIEDVFMYKNNKKIQLTNSPKTLLII